MTPQQNKSDTARRTTRLQRYQNGCMARHGGWPRFLQRMSVRESDVVAGVVPNSLKLTPTGALVPEAGSNSVVCVEFAVSADGHRLAIQLHCG
jgi:hypothetical protein